MPVSIVSFHKVDVEMSIVVKCSDKITMHHLLCNNGAIVGFNYTYNINVRDVPMGSTRHQEKN